MILQKADLINILKDIITRIEANDSFEGNLDYSMMVEGLKYGEFDVHATWRVGNSMGQGGCSIIQ